MNRIKHFIKEHYEFLFMIMMLASTIPFVIISFYSRPCADDLPYSVLTHNAFVKYRSIIAVLKAAIKTDIDFYNKWQGLYVSSFFMSLQPGIFGEKYYFVGALILQFILYAGIRYFISTLFECLKIDKNVNFYSILTYVLIIQGMPSVLEAFYWFNGAINYVPFFLLVLLNMSFLLKYFFSEGKNHYLLWSSLTSFIISGGNHVTSFMNILLLIVLCVYSFVTKKKRKIIISLIFALIGFVIMLIAPGTSTRFSATRQLSVFQTIYYTALHYIQSIIEFSDLKWLSYLALLTPLASCFKLDHISKNKLINPLFYFLLYSMIICGMIAVPYYSISNPGAQRTRNMYHFAYVFFSGMLYVYTLVYLKNKYNGVDRSIQKISDSFIFVIVTFALGVVICTYKSNDILVTGDLVSGEAKIFASQYDERYRMMANAKPDEILVFEPLIDCDSLKFDDISGEVDKGWNDEWTQYYGVKCIVKDQR